MGHYSEFYWHAEEEAERHRRTNFIKKMGMDAESLDLSTLDEEEIRLALAEKEHRRRVAEAETEARRKVDDVRRMGY